MCKYIKCLLDGSAIQLKAATGKHKSTIIMIQTITVAAGMSGCGSFATVTLEITQFDRTETSAPMIAPTQSRPISRLSKYLELQSKTTARN